GDTKIMPRGTLNEIIMATTGIGIKDKKIKILDNHLKAGDKIILTGSIGDHGTSLMASREGLNISTDLKSDISFSKFNCFINISSRANTNWTSWT
ncbi:unnamed protein product, partial [marine sediment metagenome]